MLTEQELNEINGGALKLTAGGFLIAGGVISFVIGLIDGYLRPLSCKNSN